MGELTVIGFNPGHSVLHQLDPRTKQLLMMGLGVMSLWGNLAFLSALTVLLLVLFYIAGIRMGRLIHETRYFLFFLLFVFGARALTFDSGWIPAVSTHAVVEATIVCWRLLLVVCMGVLLMATTRTAHIRAALVWYLKPVPLVNERMAATMVGLVVRFIPVILGQASEISDAQRARCVENNKNPIRRLVRYTIPLLRRVFTSADELAAAMQARCYNDNRTLPDLCLSRRDGMALLAGFCISSIAFLPAVLILISWFDTT